MVQPSRLILAGALLLYLGGFAALGLLTGRTRRLYLVIALWVGLISLGLLLYLQRPVYTRPLRSIEVGEIWARGDRAFLRDWYSVFALRETKLKLLLAPEVAVRQVASSHDLNWTLTPEQNRLQLKLGREQMAHLLLEQPISFPVTFKVQPAGADVRAPQIDIYNDSDRPLVGAVLWWQGRFYWLGTIGAHDKLQRALEMGLSSFPLSKQDKEFSIKQRLLASAESGFSPEPMALRDWYSVFALRETKLKLLLAPEVAVRQVASSHDLNWTLTPEQNRLQLKLGREQMAHLLLEQPISFPVTFKVQPAGADVRAPQIDIYNDSDRPLVGAVLWWQGRFYWLGTIGAHDKLQRALEMGLSSFPLSKQDKEFSIKQRLLASAESGFSPEPMALLAWVQQAYLGQLSGEYRRVLQLAIVAGQ